MNTNNDTNIMTLDEFIEMIVNQYGILPVVDNYLELREDYYNQKRSDT